MVFLVHSINVISPENVEENENVCSFYASTSSVMVFCCCGRWL